MTTLRLGTRGSQLALWQANTVAALLKTHARVACEIVVIKTSGDRLSEANLSAVGGKRLFVKEIEDALLRGEVDLAVHSCKDMPVVLPEGLAIGAVLPREDPRDILVLAPTALEAFAADANARPGTIEEVYEPYLIQLGFLNRTPRGRVATEQAFDYFNVKRKLRSDDQPALF
jgi:hydroxymethylbilane synthase